jgi:hypothetical protein
VALKGFHAYKRACTVCCDYDACAQCLPAGVQAEVDSLLAGKGPQPSGCWLQENLARK